MQIESEVEKFRRMMVLLEKLASVIPSPWTDELLSIIREQTFLYRCPVHGDREHVEHKNGVLCERSLPVPNFGVCTETAVFIGMVKREI